MNQEISILIELLNSVDGEIEYFGNMPIELQIIADNINKIRPFEKPDMYIPYEESVFLIEHFEFDSSANSSKGSDYRREMSRIDKIEEKSPYTNNQKYLHEQINCKQTTKNYIANAVKHFDAHYRKIEMYKQHYISSVQDIREENIKICFFIQDTTILGNIYDSHSGQPSVKPLILCHCKQFLDHFESNKKVDCLLCTTSFGDHTYIWFLTQQTINNYRTRQVDLDNITICQLAPQAIAFSAIIDKKDI